MKRTATWILAAAVVACGGSGDAVDTGGDQNIEERTDADELPTEAQDVGLLSGYNSVFDEGGTEDACVAFEDPSAVNNLRVTGLDTKIDAQFISAHSQIDNSFGIDAALGAKAEILGIDLHGGFSNSFHKSDTSYAYLLRVTGSYGVVAARRVTLNDPGKAALAAGPDQFLKRCGDSFVSGLTYTATLYILMQFDAPTEESAKAFAAGIGADVNATVAGHGVSANGGVDAGASHSSEQDRVRVSFTLHAEGFTPKGSGPLTLPTTPDSKVSSDTIAALSGYIDALTSSIAADRATDATACNASTTCFASNIGRQAQPTRIVRGQYAHANGFDSAPDPTPGLKPRLDRARGYLNAYGKLKFALEDVYADEIKPFNDADDGTKPRYNLAPPAKPLGSVQEVAAVVQKVEPIFRPTDALDVSGNVLGPINKRLRDCLHSVDTVGSDNTIQYTPCGASPTSEPEYQTGVKALKAYASSRVLQARFFSVAQDTLDDAACTKRAKQNDAAGLDLAFPDKDAIQRLAPALRAIGGADGCGFYADNSCAGDPIFQNGSFTCDDPFLGLGKKSCETLCVPSTGVFGIVTPLPSP